MLEAAHVQPAWALIAYLIAGVCFILALRGLSSPESSRRGNRLGIIGMAIAVGTTLATHFPTIVHGGIPDGRLLALDNVAAAEILAAIAIGGTIGLITARKIQMT